MNFYYFMGWSQASFVKYLNSNLGYKTEEKPADGRTILVESENSLIICLWTKEKQDRPTLAHEAVHAACFTLSHAGVHPSFDNDEPLAYLTGLIVKKAA